jgi:3-hydroxymyristoyl/3-hydroxydecanoyl-(acyl carrier protein) dehydratase
VVPGDQLRIEVTVLAWRKNAVRMEGQIFVGDKRVCEATVSCRVVPRTVTAAGNSENEAGS